MEERLAPAGFNSLVSQADPSLFADTGGGASFVENSAFPSSTTRIPQNISADGRYVVLTSSAANLVAGQVDNNHSFDVFVYDRTTNVTQLISHPNNSPLVAGNRGSGTPVISADGRYVAFVSEATDLVAGMTAPIQGLDNIFLFDRLTDSCVLVSRAQASPTAGASDNAKLASLSANGQVVTFTSNAANLYSSSTGQSQFDHAFAFDRTTGQVTLLDHANGDPTTPGNQAGTAGAITPDGRYLLLSSKATDLMATATAFGRTNAYRYDRQTGNLVLISQSSGAAPWGGNGNSFPWAISDDGQSVVFSSAATNLTGGSNVANQAYLSNVAAGTITLVSHAPGAPQTAGNAPSFAAGMSADGKYVAYLSLATNLVAGFSDGNASTSYDVFLFDRTLDQTTLISHAQGSFSTSGNGGTVGYLAKISTDGRYVIFPDQSTNLIAGFVDSNTSFSHDLYRYDRTTGTTSLISGHFGSATIGGNQESLYADINADGMVVAVASYASDQMTGLQDTNGTADVFVRDYTAGTTVLASRRAAPSLSPGGDSQWMHQSADGRFVVFTSNATNLVPGQVDNEQTQDIFLRDRQTNSTILVSRAVGTVATVADGRSAIPLISDDGRYITYSSYASNLVTGFVDGSTGTDIYLFDRLTGANVLVSHQAGSPNIGGNQLSGAVSGSGYYMPSISADGRYVAYYSLANNLIAGFVDNNGTTVSNNTGSDIYLFDRVSGTNTVVSHAAGLPLSGGNDSSYQPHISSDGRYVTYWSNGSTMVSGMTNDGGVFVYDRQTDTTVLVSHVPGAPGAGRGGQNPTFSKDGRFIVYHSGATDLIAGGSDTNGQDDVFLYDMLTGTNVLVSHAHNSSVNAGSNRSRIEAGLYSTINQAISADGRFVVFTSTAQNLVPGFVNNNSGLDDEAYLFDRLSGVVTLVSHIPGSSSATGDRDSFYPRISGDGRFVAFGSSATTLVAGFVPVSYGNLYLYDRILSTTVLIDHTQDIDVRSGSGQSFASVLSNNGSVISFLSYSEDLVSGDYNNFTDVFSYIQLSPTVLSVQFGDGSDQRSMVKQIVVTFSEPVSFMGSIASAFTLHRQGSVGDVTLSANPASGLTSSVTITFSGGFTESGGSLVDGRYDFLIDAAQVSGVGGALDGNSDGIAGGSYVINGTAANKFYRLFGDSEGDGAVSQVDAMAFIGAMGSGPSVEFDFDGDGQVNTLDLIQFRNRFGAMV